MRQDARRYLIAGILLLVGAGLTQGARALRGEETKYEPDFSQLPERVGEYEGRDLPVDKSIYNYLEAQAMVERVYEGPDGWVLYTLIYGTDWRTIHAPTGCYPAQGWTMTRNETVAIPAPEECPHKGPIHARAVFAEKGDRREVSLFVYARPGDTTSSWATHGAKVAVGPRGAGGMIIILRTLPKTDDLDAEIKPLTRMLAALYSKSVSFWYEDAGNAG